MMSGINDQQGIELRGGWQIVPVSDYTLWQVPRNIFARKKSSTHRIFSGCKTCRKNLPCHAGNMQVEAYALEVCSDFLYTN
jgi:hypothetical protein